jgi:hypothetical protein
MQCFSQTHWQSMLQTHGPFRLLEMPDLAKSKAVHSLPCERAAFDLAKSGIPRRRNGPRIRSMLCQWIGDKHGMRAIVRFNCSLLYNSRALSRACVTMDAAIDDAPSITSP